MQWYYLDPQREVQGPCNIDKFKNWAQKGYFTDSQLLSNDDCGPFLPLDFIFPSNSLKVLSTKALLKQAESTRDLDEWYFCAPDESIQGPFPNERMHNWVVKGYLKGDTLIKMEGISRFLELRDVFPFYKNDLRGVFQSNRKPSSSSDCLSLAPGSSESLPRLLQKVEDLEGAWFIESSGSSYLIQDGVFSQTLSDGQVLEGSVTVSDGDWPYFVNLPSGRLALKPRAVYLETRYRPHGHGWGKSNFASRDWYYRGQDANTYGPYPNCKMRQWFLKGHFQLTTVLKQLKSYTVSQAFPQGDTFDMTCLLHRQTPEPRPETGKIGSKTGSTQAVEPHTEASELRNAIESEEEISPPASCSRRRRKKKTAESSRSRKTSSPKSRCSSSLERRDRSDHIVDHERPQTISPKSPYSYNYKDIISTESTSRGSQKSEAYRSALDSRNYKSDMPTIPDIPDECVELRSSVQIAALQLPLVPASEKEKESHEKLDPIPEGNFIASGPAVLHGAPYGALQVKQQLEQQLQQQQQQQMELEQQQLLLRHQQQQRHGLQYQEEQLSHHQSPQGCVPVSAHGGVLLKKNKIGRNNIQSTIPTVHFVEESSDMMARVPPTYTWGIRSASAGAGESPIHADVSPVGGEKKKSNKIRKTPTPQHEGAGRSNKPTLARQGKETPQRPVPHSMASSTDTQTGNYGPGMCME